MYCRCLFLALAISSPAWSADPGMCRPAAEIQEALAKAAAVPITEPFAAFQNVAPYQQLRERFPDNLFVHEAYQDAMHEHGIEGHLRHLTRQYDELKQQHPGELMFEYLAWRTQVGRDTLAAIDGLNDLAEGHPGFAPAHRTLAEIYATEAFRDPQKEVIERTRFLKLCPNGTFTARPPGIPKPNRLITEAERLFSQGGDPNRIIEMAMQGQREFEWRTQRIRAFDWFTPEFKREDARELRARNWQALALRVRCYRKAGRSQEAAATLAQLQQRLRALTDSDSAYWNGLDTLVQLYLDGNQKGAASKLWSEMRRIAGEHPSPERSARVEALANLLGAPVAN